MKAFAFSLEKMRSFKSQLLDEEINLLLNLRMQREQIAEKIALLEQFRMEKDAELLQRALRWRNARTFSTSLPPP